MQSPSSSKGACCSASERDDKATSCCAGDAPTGAGNCGSAPACPGSVADARRESAGCCDKPAAVPATASCCDTPDSPSPTLACCDKSSPAPSGKTGCCDTQPAASTRSCCASACSNDTDTPVATDKPGTWVRIANMDCATEEGEIRRALARLEGIRTLQFRLGQRQLLIDADAPVLEQAFAAIRKAGFNPVPVSEKPSASPAADTDAGCSSCDDDHEHAHGQEDSGDSVWKLGAALTLAIAAELVHLWGEDLPMMRYAGMALAVAAIALSGFSTYQKGLAALRHGRLSINALMTVAVTGAFLIGQWPEAAMVMALYALAEWLEARSAARARNAIGQLLELAPEQADVLQADGQWRTLPVKQIEPGAVLRVKAGERIALDGVITSGHSAIDQSSVTGESIPVDKGTGDGVFAGTINGTGVLQMRSTSTAQDTTLARIIHAVEEAQHSRAPTQGFVDRFAAVYTPLIFALALAVALGGPLLFGWSWLDAIYKALVLLVIGCPCALVIATPVTIVSALTAGARRGLLFKGGIHLEQARLLKAVALDKTGTLTHGRPQLIHSEWFVAPARENEIRALALALAGESDHPVSRAIATGLQAMGAHRYPGVLQHIHAVPGHGVQAELEGAPLLLGQAGWITRVHGELGAVVQQAVSRQLAEGRTVTLLADEQQVLAVFAVADQLRGQAAQAVGELQALGLHTVMLSGDHQLTADAIAHQAGLAQARGNLLPEHKLEAIRSLQRSHGPTAMVGDGINDAPALASADMGIAMGGAGTDIAMEAADVVVMNDDLRRVPEAIRLSRHTHEVLWQNIALALGIKLVVFVLALMGHATMWMAVFADMGASLLVVFNGLRLLRWRS